MAHSIRNLFVFITLILILAIHISADTYIYEDTIYGDEVWDLNGSPYIIKGTVFIEDSASFTIDPGVIIYCSTYTCINNKGYFFADGAIFNGDTSRISLEIGSTGIITNCDFYYVSFICWGICSLSVTNSSFVHFWNVFMLMHGATPVIENNLYSIPDRTGIRLHGLNAGINWHLPKYEIPYSSVYINLRDDSSNILSFDPGVIINFGVMSKISIGTGDSLNLSNATLIGCNRTHLSIRDGAEGYIDDCDIYAVPIECRSISSFSITRNYFSNVSKAIFLGNETEPTINGNTFENNEYAIYINNSFPSNVSITDNYFYGNKIGLFNAQVGYDIKAENNWWGSSSGPQHVDNPAGTGDSIIGEVDYTPWLSTTDVIEIDDPIIPKEFELLQNYPNPFNNETKIEFVLQHKSHVKLEIHNILGQTVRTLVDEELSRGRKYIIWDGTNVNGNVVASGTYFYKIKADNFVESRKMQLVK